VNEADLDRLCECLRTDFKRRNNITHVVVYPWGRIRNTAWHQAIYYNPTFFLKHMLYGPGHISTAYLVRPWR
jgi:hypothetical protein